MPGPMEGVRVVELGVWVAGPAAGGVLADWGADVVKIEPPDRRPRPHVPAHARRRHAEQPGVRARQPVEAQRRDRPPDRRRPRARARAPRRRRRVRHQHPAECARPHRARPRHPARTQPAPRLRDHHRLRPRRPRRRSCRLRHRGVLGAVGHRTLAHAARRQPAVPTRRHGRSLRRVCPARARSAPRSSPARRPARGSWCRPRCCARACTRSASTSTWCSAGVFTHRSARAKPWAIPRSTTTRRATGAAFGSWGSKANATGHRSPAPSGIPNGSTDERFSTPAARSQERPRADRRCSTRPSPPRRSTSGPRCSRPSPTFSGRRSTVPTTSSPIRSSGSRAASSRCPTSSAPPP